jgi:DNA-binding transcriptional MerR regulator
MVTFSIGEAELLTGIPAYTLRHWDAVVPASAPQKGFGGARVYTVRDIAAIRRMHRLRVEQQLSVEAARTRFLGETAALLHASDAASAQLAILQGLRAELYALLTQASHLRYTL